MKRGHVKAFIMGLIYDWIAAIERGESDFELGMQSCTL